MDNDTEDVAALLEWLASIPERVKANKSPGELLSMLYRQAPDIYVPPQVMMRAWRMDCQRAEKLQS